MTSTFLITGGTGQQGGHTARLLLQAGYRVHVLARNPSSPAAIELESRGAIIFPGDFSDIDSITAAAHGCKGVFLNVSPVFTDTEGELKHARNVITACQQAGVKKMVQSSVPQRDVPLAEIEGSMKGYFTSKKACEYAVRSSAGFDTWTILRPARLLSSYIAPLAAFMFPDLKNKGIIRTALDKEVKIPVLDPMDVGRFAVQALLDETGRFDEKIIPMAIQDMTLDEVVAAMNRALGKQAVRIDYLSEDEIAEVKGKNLLIDSELWFNKCPMVVDPAEMKSFGIQTNLADEFFSREKKSLAEAVGA